MLDTSQIIACLIILSGTMGLTTGLIIGYVCALRDRK